MLLLHLCPFLMFPSSSEVIPANNTQMILCWHVAKLIPAVSSNDKQAGDGKTPLKSFGCRSLPAAVAGCSGFPHRDWNTGKISRFLSDWNPAGCFVGVFPGLYPNLTVCCQGDVWICMELMDTSLDKFYKQVIEKGMTIPEDILGKIAVSVGSPWTLWTV